MKRGGWISAIPLGVLVAVLVGTLLWPFLRDVRLRDNLRRAEEPHYVFQGSLLAQMARVEAKGEKIVLNTFSSSIRKALSFSFQVDLLINDSTCGVHGVFDRIGDIGVDSDGNIYVSEVRLGVIRKFDLDGKYVQTIGRKGQGPGELELPGLLCLDDSTLHVLDVGNSRISTFTRSGKFVRSFQVEFKRTVAGMALGAAGEVYVSTYDPKTGRVIHVFDRRGRLLASFGEPVAFRKPMKLEDEVLRSNISCGPILAIGDSLWYCQRNPFELRLYRHLDGHWNLLLRSFIDGDILPPCTLSYLPGGVVSFRLPAGARFMGTWSNWLVIDLWIPDAKWPKPQHRLVFVDFEGRVKSVHDMPGEVAMKRIDRHGHFYGRLVGPDGVPAVVRYRVSVSTPGE